MTQAVIAGGRSRTVKWVNDIDGQAIRRDEVSSSTGVALTVPNEA